MMEETVNSTSESERGVYRGGRRQVQDRQGFELKESIFLSQVFEHSGKLLREVNSVINMGHRLELARLALDGSTGERLSTLSYITTHSKRNRNTKKAEVRLINFFRRIHLSDVIPYELSFKDLLNQHANEVLQRVDKASKRYVVWMAPQTRVLLAILKNNSIQDVTQALFTNPHFSSVKKAEEYSRKFAVKLFPEINTLRVMDGRRIPVHEIWNIERAKAIERLEATDRYLTDTERNVLKLAVNVFADRKKSYRDGLAEMAKLTSTTEDTILGSIHRSIHRLFSDTELREMGIHVTLWEILQTHNRQIRDLIDQEEKRIQSKRNNYLILRNLLHGIVHHKMSLQMALTNTMQRFQISKAQIMNVLIDDLLPLFPSRIKKTFYGPSDVPTSLDSQLFGGTALEVYLAQMRGYPMATRTEEIELSKRIQQTGDPAAKRRLVEANLRLVVSIATPYAKGDMQLLLTLIQEGNLGLMRAAEKYDWKKGVPFGNYASLWIRQRIALSFHDLTHDIHIPNNKKRLLRKIQKVKRRLEQEKGYEPKLDEIAAVLNVSIEEVQQLLKIAQKTKRIDMELHPGTATTMADVIEDKSSGIWERVSQVELSPELEEGLAQLTKQEKLVILLRFGFVDRDTKTLEEVGKILGITKERVRQIQEKAFEKLKDVPGLSNLL